MPAILLDWLELLIRWLHVVTGIAWIGSSFYFIHLDLSLKQRPGLPDKAFGDAWQVHGGGFYHMVKYLVAPAGMPDELTWFKWEAYATWFSGFALMAVIYYLGTELYLIDTHVLALAPWQAIAISLAGLAAGWAVYDGLCRSPLGRDDRALLAVGFVFLVAAAFLFTRLFSPRGAFMEIGALIGTMMVANVLMVIIPGQRKVVKSLLAGETPDPIHGRRGKQRSLHNNYLTLPVVFVMIGNHYPFAYATRWSWAILALVIVVGVLLRHFYNSRHKGLPSPWWTWGASAACIVAAIWLSTQGPAYGPKVEAPAAKLVKASDAYDVIGTRCVMCHAAEPGWPGVHFPPKGVVMETPEQIEALAPRIASAAVWSNAMPPGNVTEIEDGERAVLAGWLEAKWTHQNIEPIFHTPKSP